MTKKRLCIGCKREEAEEEIRYCVECRMDKEIDGVLELLQMNYPKAADWNCVEKSDEQYAEILDKNDRRIGWLSERALTSLYNHVEVY